MELISARLDGKALEGFEQVMGESTSAVVRELVDAGRKHKAVELYKAKQVSLGLAARLAGVPLSAFIDLLREHNVDLNLELEDVQKALHTARKVF